MAKKAKAPKYAVRSGPEFVKLMVRAGVGEVKLDIAREALRREALREKVATVDDVLDALRADSRVFPANMARYERLADLGEDFWDKEGKEVNEPEKRPASIEDQLINDSAKAFKRVRFDSGDEDPDAEPGDLDRTDSPTFHTQDAAADETRQAIGEAVSEKEAEERAEEARKAAARPAVNPPTAGGPAAPAGGGPGTPTARQSEQARPRGK